MGFTYRLPCSQNNDTGDERTHIGRTVVEPVKLSELRKLPRFIHQSLASVFLRSFAVCANVTLCARVSGVEGGLKRQQLNHIKWRGQEKINDSHGRRTMTSTAFR